MRYGCALAAMLAFAVTPAIAQSEAAWEAQRCIWRCQAEYGAASSRYGQCVEANCNDAPVASKPRRSKSPAYKKQSQTQRTYKTAPRPEDIIVRRIRPVYAD